MAPHYQQQLYLRPSSSCFSTSRTNGPRLLSLPKAGTHSPFREKSHTRAHTPKQGCFGWGWYHYPRIVLRGSETLRGQGGRTANFAAFGSWPGVLPKNAESLRNSDALMRVAVPRRRGPAGTRSPTAIPRFAPMGPTVFSVTTTGRRETYLLFHTLVCSMRLATRCRSFALSTASNCRW